MTESGDPTHPVDLLAVYALDSLDEEERNEVRVHLKGCSQCRAALVELREAVDALPFATHAVPPPPSSRAKLLARIAADRAGDVADRG